MGSLKVIDTTSQSFPIWDYKHTNIITDYPIVMYYNPLQENSCIYTIKCYWKSNEYTDGFLLIMDDSTLPNQGACIATFNIINNRLVKDSDCEVTPQVINILNNVPLFQSYR